MGGEEEEGEGKEKERVHEYLLKEAAMEGEGAIVHTLPHRPQSSVSSLVTLLFYVSSSVASLILSPPCPSGGVIWPTVRQPSALSAA